MALEITVQNFESTVLSAEKPVLIDFWAPWCGPCKALTPVIEELSTERTDIIVGKVNVDEQMELAQKYGIMTIPTLIVFKNGEIVNQTVGLKSKEELLYLLGV